MLFDLGFVQLQSEARGVGDRHAPAPVAARGEVGDAMAALVGSIGQPSVGPNNVVHYAYATHGAGADEGDIYYVRSTDLGATWSVPLLLNTDVGGRAQWMPSVSVTTA